jgi:hypothetical protein
MENRLWLRLPPLPGKRRCAPIGRRSFRRRRRYVVTVAHSPEPLQLKAADLRELQAYLRAEHPNKPIASIRDERGNLAGSPQAATRVDQGRWRLVVKLAPVEALGLGALGYGLSWLLE